MLLCAAIRSLPALAVDLATLDQQMTGRKTQVLVLGSVHLSELGNPFSQSTLDPVLEKLASFAPEIITIEALSGEECDLAQRHPEKYGSEYCSGNEVAQKATGLDVPAAMAAVTRQLDTWPAAPSADHRRQLAALFLSAHDHASAYVQWLRLPPEERHATTDFPQSLVDMLNSISKRNNENYQLAARLAATLGLDRVYAVDNHTGDNIVYRDRDAFGREIMAAWQAGRASLDAMEQQLRPLEQQTDFLPLYRFINAPDYLETLAKVNVAAALQARSSTGYPQTWVSGWDIRNLRMVANIAETFREKPGSRVLCVVGASHKPWFDHWLGQLQGVEIVNATAMMATK